MLIRRIEVEGGFLDGLDLDLATGFNAIIGARGTGKTSVIELIRFALAVPVLTEHLKTTTRHQAEAVLADGTVTVTIAIGGREVRMSRSINQRSAREQTANVMVLAQNEIEGIGNDALSRLRLIDGFITEPPGEEARHSITTAETEYSALKLEIAALDEQLAAVAPAVEELLAARQEQRLLQAKTEGLTRDAKKLDSLNQRGQVASRALEHARRIINALTAWEAATRTAADATPSFENLTDDAFAAIRAQKEVIDAARRSLDGVLLIANQMIQSARNAAQALEGQIGAVEAEARPLRAQLEAAQRGAGDVARRIAALERRVAKGEAIAEVRNQRRQRLEAARGRRSQALDEIERMSAKRTLAREKVAQKLSRHLRPSIRVEIAQKANLSEYIAAITRVLRGTGMHAATLAQQIANRISPRQLIELTEAGDRSGLSRILQISADRAERLMNALSGAAADPLLEARVEDDVVISLLVGPDYKPVQYLSTGQRCTAVIPILLSRESGALIIDQPEDHLDNAYVVDTLVKAVRTRSASLQVVFSTHNANLPVLGEADRVIEMASDGLHGYARVADVLDSDAAVAAISSVMEGGKEAFARRAAFYQAHEL